MVLVARPPVNDGEVFNQHRALDGAFADRHQFDSAQTLANGVLLISQSGVKNTKGAESRGIIGLVAYRLLKFFSGAVKGGTGCWLIAAEPSSKALAPTVRKGNVFVVATTAIDRNSRKRPLGCDGIAFAQG